MFVITSDTPLEVNSVQICNDSQTFEPGRFKVMRELVDANN